MGHVLFVGASGLLKGDKEHYTVPSLFASETQAVDFVAASCGERCDRKKIMETVAGKAWQLDDLSLLNGGLAASASTDALPLPPDTPVGQWALQRLPEGKMPMVRACS
jgi:hypothetical protein